VYVLLHNSAGLLLLQRRAAAKSVAPGCWDLTVAEHVAPGESYEEAARRGLREELRIPLGAAAEPARPPLDLHFTLPARRRALRYTTAAGARIVDNEFIPLLEGSYDGSCAPDGDEVAAVRWVAWATVLAEVAADESAFTPWFVETLRLLGRVPRAGAS
jgi:isopentenyl-diphosphate delta-isomerase